MKDIPSMLERAQLIFTHEQLVAIKQAALDYTDHLMTVGGTEFPSKEYTTKFIREKIEGAIAFDRKDRLLMNAAVNTTMLVFLYATQKALDMHGIDYKIEIPPAKEI